MTRGLGLVAESECEAMASAASAAYHPVNLIVEPLAEMKDDDEPKSHWLKVPMSKTSALSVTENFVKKSNWFRSKKQRQLLEQMAQPQPLTGNIYRYMAALVNVATDQDPASNPDSSGCCTCCCDCRKCCSSSWWRLTPGRKREREEMTGNECHDSHTSLHSTMHFIQPNTHRPNCFQMPLDPHGEFQRHSAPRRGGAWVSCGALKTFAQAAS